jgi:hypothetical protein
LRNHQAGRDPDNNQSDKQDGHLDFLPHCNLPPVELLPLPTRWLFVVLCKKAFAACKDAACPTPETWQAPSLQA